MPNSAWGASSVLEPALKVCTGCGKTKPEEDFPWNQNAKGAPYRRGRCNDCQKAYLKEWYAANSQRQIESVTERRKAKRGEAKDTPPKSV
jgi:hypothetical protein